MDFGRPFWLGHLRKAISSGLVSRARSPLTGKRAKTVIDPHLDDVQSSDSGSKSESESCESAAGQAGLPLPPAPQTPPNPDSSGKRKSHTNSTQSNAALKKARKQEVPQPAPALVPTNALASESSSGQCVMKRYTPEMLKLETCIP